MKTKHIIQWQENKQNATSPNIWAIGVILSRIDLQFGKIGQNENETKH